ncbi:hypothetical protein JCM15765_40640 [Paradesulfitobacterium aromaticivorans]
MNQLWKQPSEVITCNHVYGVKLRGQLLLFTGLLVLVPLLLIGYLVDQRVSAAMTEQALAHNAHVGNLVQTEVQRFVEIGTANPRRSRVLS